MTRSQAIKRAVKKLSLCDHGILDKKTALEIAEPFGFKPTLQSIADNRSEFKGAHFPSLKEGEVAHEVIPAHVLAMEICEHLGLKFPDMFGIGSQLFACLKVLENQIV